MIKLEHAGLGVEFQVRDLKQKHVARQGAALRELLSADSISLETASTGEYYGCAVQSAFDAGWFLEPETLDVDESSPAMIKWLAQEINRIYLEATEIPKN